MSEPTLDECRAELARVLESCKGEFITLPESETGQYIDALRRGIARKEREQAVYESMPLIVGDAVRKVGGEYQLDGVIRAVIVKASGAVRYAVEVDRIPGMLMIYSAANLVRRGDAPQPPVPAFDREAMQSVLDKLVQGYPHQTNTAPAIRALCATVAEVDRQRDEITSLRANCKCLRLTADLAALRDAVADAVRMADVESSGMIERRLRAVLARLVPPAEPKEGK